MSTSKKIRAVAALGTLSAGVWAGTFATFTDSGTSASTFSSGTVDLLLNDEADDDYGFVGLSTSNMKPGDVTYAPLTVKNAGSLGYSWTMSSSESETALSGELQLSAVTGAVTCDGTGYTAAALVPANVVIPSGDLAAAAVATPRSLAAGASETLCVRVELPSATTNDFQGLTTTSTFTFSATQS
jgi:hypothetical protein